MKKLFPLFALLAVLFSCKNSTEIEWPTTSIQVKVVNDTGALIKGATVKIYDDKELYENDKAQGSGANAWASGFTTDTGVVVFDGLNAEKDHYFLVTARDRQRFLDLNNYDSTFLLSAANFEQGSQIKAQIHLQQAKSSFSFYSLTLPEDQMPVKVFIGEDSIGSLKAITSVTPTGPEYGSDSVLSFRLSQGNQKWYAKSNAGCFWTGELEVDGTEGHKAIELKDCEAGVITFWTKPVNQDVLPVTITLNRVDEVKQLEVAHDDAPSTCLPDGYLNISREPGEYTYYAKSDNSSCQWTGKFTLDPNGCVKIELDECQQ